MNALWIDLPAGFRLVLVAMFGLIGGALANYVIYRFAYFNPRPISPWGPPAEGAQPRPITDRIPVWGWWGLRRESSIHGEAFWIRPMLIELGTAIGLVMLYQFETQTGGLLPRELQFPKFLAGFESIATHVFFSHAILMVLMVAATFIDFDERTIPDVITIPGTLIALVIASTTVLVFMPTSLPVGQFAITADVTTFDSPWFMPGKWMTTTGWWTGLGFGACGALRWPIVAGAA